MSELNRLNAEKMGVYYVVNKGGDADDQITGITAQFFECDSISKEEQWKLINTFPLQPSIVVETPKSLHVYYLVKDAEVSWFRPMQKRFVLHFGADPACINESRVMRLPGFYHQKKDPFMVKCPIFHPERVYTQDELAKYLPEIAPQPKGKSVEGIVCFGLKRVCGCSFIKECLERRFDLPEPYWHALAGQFKPFKGGLALFHQYSQDYPQYNLTDAENKFNQYRAGPMHCDVIFEKTGFQCPTQGSCSANSPAELFKIPLSDEELFELLVKELDVSGADITTIIAKCKGFLTDYGYNLDKPTTRSFISTVLKSFVNREASKDRKLQTSNIDMLVSYQSQIYQDYRNNLKEVTNQKALEPEHGQVEPMSEEERSKATELLKDPALIDRILKDLTYAGNILGEDENKLMMYAAMASVKQESPINVVPIAQSATGKNHLINSTAAFFPEEYIRRYTSMTSKALNYMNEDDLDHKISIIDEFEGTEEVLPTIRNIMSEHIVARAYPVKNPDTERFETVCELKKARSVILTTTTQASLHNENATRVFELYLNESVQQTQDIVKYNFERQTLAFQKTEPEREAIRRLHRNAQRLLQPVEVIIPYAQLIDFPCFTTRNRRDSARYMELIKVVAYLFQYQKDIRHDDQITYIEADLRDYFYACNIASKILRNTLADITTREMKVLEVVKALITERVGKKHPFDESSISFTRREIEQYAASMKIDLRNKEELNKHLKSLTEKDFVTMWDGGPGKQSKYNITFTLNDDFRDAITYHITTPDELATKLKRVTDSNRVKSVET